jgi:hypothetical protein
VGGASNASTTGSAAGDCPGPITGDISGAGKARFGAGVPDSEAGAVDASLGGATETTSEVVGAIGAFDDGVEAPATMISLSNAALVSAANVDQLGSRAAAAAGANLSIIMALG